LVVRITKLFTVLLIMLERSTQLFLFKKLYRNKFLDILVKPLHMMY